MLQDCNWFTILISNLKCKSRGTFEAWRPMFSCSISELFEYINLIRPPVYYLFIDTRIYLMICKSSPFFWLHSVTHFVLLFRGNFKLTKQRFWKYKKSKENTKTQGKSFCSSAFRHTLGALFRKNTVSLNFQLNFVSYNWSFTRDLLIGIYSQARCKVSVRRLNLYQMLCT